MKIKKIYLNHFRAFYGEYFFNFEEKNVLIYGENGSGKSSLYYALKTLINSSHSKEKDRMKKCFIKEESTFLGNIFAYNKTTKKGKVLDLGSLSLEFIFDDNSQILLEELQENDELPKIDKKIQNTYLFNPFLHYKKILRVHSVQKIEAISNLFSLFETLLQGYPINNNTFLIDLKEKNYKDYLNQLKKIIDKELKNKISYFLEKFDLSIKVEDIIYSEELTSEKTIRKYELDIIYNSQKITNWSHFLNEGRLSSISISIYLATIQIIREKLNESLDILVLDDLLLGLDMSNRMSIIKILNEDFKSFQIFFFTYDKALFEVFKRRIQTENWKIYELYNEEKELSHIQDELGNNLIIEKPITLESFKTYLEKAKKFLIQNEYDCCGIFLRKELEEICEQFLKENEKRDKNCKVLNLSKQLNQLGKKYSYLKETIQNIEKIRMEILNPSSHNDKINPTFQHELKQAVDWIETLKKELKKKNGLK